MKQNNIFERLKPKANVPVSLFPASSMVRTSMRIGRATPMYSINMFQGNRIKLSASQLTRFATLNHPVMNNYEISLGFFFCPWKAHDEMGTSAWFRKFINQSSVSEGATGGILDIMSRYKLNADEFFDPAFDNALRHHPIMVKLKNLGNIKLVGSLYDHLNYYIGDNTDVDSFAKFYAHTYNANNGATGGTNFRIDSAVGGSPSYFKYDSTSQSWVENKLGVMSNTSTASTLTNTDRVVLPLDVWTIMNYYYGLGERVDNVSFAEAQSFISGYSNIFATPTIQKLIGAVHQALAFDDTSTLTPVGEWKDFFGRLLPSEVLDAYYAYVKSIAVFDIEGNYQLNCVKWLTYMRIYADWFLNDHYTRRDDFLDMIGVAYYNACRNLSTGNWSVQSAFSVGTSYSSWIASNGKLVANPELRFFADYIRRGECLPVLWELSRMTAQRCEVDIQGLAGLTDTASSLSPADTAVGTTIREHFFNRAVQKFKDLISRVGYDFRNNTRVLYGSGVSDSTLNRSQLIAVKKFAVNIGDVQQTSSSSKDGNLGDFGGFAFSKNGTDSVEWTAEQNGTFMVLAWVRPRNVSIASGSDREDMKKDYLDYLIPTFGGVGYQDVFANEVFASAQNGNTALGHEEIYSEYMSKQNYVSGTMRTFNRNWHSDRFLTKNPTIAKNGSPEFFYICDDKEDLNRIFANQVDDPILCTCYFDGNITRQLPSRIRTDF